VVPGDTLKVEFLDSTITDWDTELLVRSDGAVSIPKIGDVKVSGLTISAIQEKVRSELAKLSASYSNINISLAAAARLVFVGGEVTEPGAVTFTGSTVTLLEAIILAGGPLKESADLSSVIILREDGAGVRHSWKWDMEPLLTDAKPPQPVRLRNRDVVIVPNSSIDRVNLWVKNYISDMIPNGAALVALFLAE
jgi:protein involved in polysaccharide export with SLBB domain